MDEETEEAPAPEGRRPGQEVQPNVHFTVPSPLVAPLSVTTNSAIPSPYVLASFLGQPDLPAVGTTTRETPPDTNGAVGRDKLMVPLNSNYVIQRKSDGAVLSRVSMTTFWKPLGAHNPFDPRVLYDPYSNRWLASAADDPLLSSSLILYGISDTDDPLGSWHLYAIHSDETGTTWADFPDARLQQEHGRDRREHVRHQLAELRARPPDRARLRLAASRDGRQPGRDRRPRRLLAMPATADSPTETTLYLVEHLDGFSATYRFWSLNGTTLTLVGGAPRTNPLGAWASPGALDIAPQQGTLAINAGDSRIGSAVFRNGHVWYAQTVGFPPGLNGYVLRTAIQWVELDTNGAFVQGGRIEDPLASPWNGRPWYAFGSLAVNARNDVLVGFSEFESDDFADAGYAFRSGTDPPGAMGKPVTLKDGEGPYVKRREDERNRWGDSAHAGRPLGRPVALDDPGVRAHPGREGRPVGTLGHVVGPRRRRPAAPASPLPRAEGRREAARQGVAPDRRGALPPRQRSAGQGDEAPARPRPPPVAQARHPLPERHEARPAGRPLT